MVEIKAFNGIIYNQDKVGDVGAVIAPPYDVINAEMQQHFYAKDPHNIIRLILGKESPADTENDNRYIRARDTFQEWLKQGVLTKNKKPGIYVLSQEDEVDGRKRKRVGFISLLRVEEEYGNVLPHEHTHPKPIEDRLKLLDTCSASFDQIFMIYNDPSRTIDKLLEVKMKEKPLISLVDEGGVTNKIWVIDEEMPVKEICAHMKNIKVIIADGHHRYETAKRFYSRKKGKNPVVKGEQPYDFTPVYFANTAGEFTVLPIYRLFKKVGQLDLTKASEFFSIENLASSEALLAALAKNDKRTAFGFLGKGISSLLILKDPQAPLKLIDGDHQPEWKKLDVTVLHKILLPKLGIFEKDNIDYTVKLAEAEEKLKKGEAELAVFLNPTRVGQVINIATARALMPQKSTFFYPKLLSGLVMREF